MLKVKLIFVTLLFLLTNLTAQQMSSIKKYQEIISKVKKEFAPDKRTAIFDVEVKESGNKILLTGETNLPSAKEKLISEINDKNVVDEIKTLPEKYLGDKVFGVVVLSVANVRTKPANSAEMATQALLGTPVKVLKKKKDGSLFKPRISILAGQILMQLN